MRPLDAIIAYDNPLFCTFDFWFRGEEDPGGPSVVRLYFHTSCSPLCVCFSTVWILDPRTLIQASQEFDKCGVTFAVMISLHVCSTSYIPIQDRGFQALTARRTEHYYCLAWNIYRNNLLVEFDIQHNATIFTERNHDCLQVRAGDWLSEFPDVLLRNTGCHIHHSSIERLMQPSASLLCFSVQHSWLPSFSILASASLQNSTPRVCAMPGNNCSWRKQRRSDRRRSERHLPHLYNNAKTDAAIFVSGGVRNLHITWISCLQGHGTDVSVLCLFFWHRARSSFEK